MEGAGAVQEGMRSVIIRTPDQRVKDMEVTCQPKWTVANLKQHLSLLYPGNPVCTKKTKLGLHSLLCSGMSSKAFHSTYCFFIYDRHLNLSLQEEYFVHRQLTLEYEPDTIVCNSKL